MKFEDNFIELCKNQDAKSFKKLYTVTSDYLYAIALRYMKNSDDAQDVVQETFIKVYHSLPNYKPIATLFTWMRRILVNTAINALKKNKRYLHDINDDLLPSEEVNNSMEDVIDKMSNDELIHLIQSLPDGYRTVINLYLIEGYDHKEIGELLQINESTSRSQLSKGKKLLIKKIEQIRAYENRKMAQ